MDIKINATIKKKTKKNKPSFLSFLKNSRREGTFNQGNDYEIKIFALIALRSAILQGDGKTFWMMQNVNDAIVGKFDDIVFVVRNKSNRETVYCMQLKHFTGSKRDKPLTYKKSFQQSSKKNPLYLKEYFASIEEPLKHPKNLEQIKYILFTNRPIDSEEQRFISYEENDNFPLINLTGSAFKLSEFEIDKNKKIDENVLQTFSVFYNQPHEENVKECIELEMQKYFNIDEENSKSMTQIYINYISDWIKGYHGGFRELSKEEVTVKIFEILIQKYIYHYPLEDYSVFNLAANLWNEAIDPFKIILLDEFDVKNMTDEELKILALVTYKMKQSLSSVTSITDWSEIINSEKLLKYSIDGDSSFNEHNLQCFLGNDYKKSLNLKSALLFLWKENKLKLPLKINNRNDLELILKAAKFTSRPMMIIYENLISTDDLEESKKGEQIDIFHSLEDLNEDIKAKIMELPFNVQGRQGKIKDITLNVEEFKNIHVKDILRIILQKFNVGEKLFQLPVNFINRTLNNIFVKPDIFKKPTIYIINCDENLFKKYVNDCKISLNLENNVHCFQTAKVCEIPENYKVFINNVYTERDIVMAIKKAKKNTCDYEMFTLKENCSEWIVEKLRPNQIRSVNVFLTSEFLFKSFINANQILLNEFEIYTFSKLHFRYLPIMSKFIIVEESDVFEFLTAIRKYDYKIKLNFFKLFEANSEIILELLGSETHCEIIQKYMYNSDCLSYYDYEKYFMLCNVNIISGQPGMGKSVFISYLINQCSLQFYIILINCNQCSQYFKSYDNDDKTLLEHLRYFINFDELDRLEKIYVTNYINNKNIIVFIDGYDELRSEVEENVCTFINNLINENYRVIISTRTIKVHELESKFDSLSRKLIPFTKTDQTNYLKRFYYSKTENTNTVAVDKFVNTLLTSTERKLSAWDTEFSGIPLQTVMISEIYLEHCLKYCKSDTGNGNDLQLNVDLLELYDKFIKLKISHLQIKDRIPAGTNLEDYFNDSVKRSLECHKLCALKQIFYQNCPTLDVDEFIEEIKVKNKIGLIDKFVEDDVPVFVHRTFAEYLSALYVTEHLKKGLVKKLLNVIYKSSVYDIIRQIMDRLLAKGHPLHCAVLNDNVDFLTDSHENELTLNHVDKGGRNILHLAMSLGIRNIIPTDKEIVAIERENSLFALNERLNVIGQSCKQHSPNVKVTETILFRDEATEETRRNVDNVLATSPLGYGIITASLLNVNLFLKRVFDTYASFDSVKHYLDRLWIYEASNESDPNEYLCDCRKLLLVCSVCDYRYIASAVISLQPKRCNLINTTYGSDEKTLLHLAAMADSCETIDLLLNGNVDVNVRDTDGCTPLHYASWAGNEMASAMLLERSANAAVSNNHGQTAKFYAILNGNAEVESLLKNHLLKIEQHSIEEEENEFFAAFAAQDLDKIRSFLNAGQDPNVIFGVGQYTPLLISSMYGHMDALKILVEIGADVNMKNEKGDTALMYAATRGHLDCVNYLLKMGADVHEINNKKANALHRAVNATGFPDFVLPIVRRILDAGIDVNVKNLQGETGLMQASHYGYLNVVKLLVERGADVNMTSNRNYTAIAYASDEGQTEVVEYLKTCSP